MKEIYEIKQWFSKVNLGPQTCQSIVMLILLYLREKFEVNYNYYTRSILILENCDMNSANG